MSRAGESARQEAERARSRVDAHLAAAEAERARLQNFLIAAETEKRTARALAPLAAAGYHLLADRRWPKSRTAQVDLVVIGPSGVWIVDTKAWRDITIAAGRVYRDQEDVTETFENLESLLETTRAALADIGLAPAEVHVVVAWAGRKNVHAEVGGVEVVGDADILRHLTRPGQRLSDVAIDSVLQAAVDFFPPVSAPAPINVTLPQPVVETVPDELDIPGLPSEEEVQAAILESLLSAPIEEWMTFLHPDQAKLILRSFNGPCRIRGGAGTGKTVVGLHRAAQLARSGPDARVLVTTFVKTLPTVLRSLLQRLAPDVADRVEFSGVHEFAGRLLAERGVRIRLDGRVATMLLQKTWASEPGRALAAIEDNYDYWREEIESVIKGRGFTSFDEYANCPRPGRRRSLGINQRRAVWDFFAAYDQALRSAEVNDFPDQILLAEAELQRSPLSGYSAVIVDEAQDLSLAMIRMLHSLVGDAPDGFTLIGDGQQSIYPGGYTLAEAGISVANRGVVFDVNYRNTAEILERAELIVSGDRYADIEEGADTPAISSTPAARHGESPIGRVFATAAEHETAMVERIRSVTRSLDTGLGDIAVLCTSNARVKDATAILTRAGVPTISLLDYDGAQTNAVKVGTINRAKGLEFKQVLLPWTRRELLSPGTGGAESIPESLAEREERDRRVLYVGMTRARDGVWVGAIRR